MSQINEIKTPPLKGVDWTSERPKESGFYWYREHGSPPEVILWEHDMQWVRIAGNDIPWGDDTSCKIEGEFWPEKLTPPNGMDDCVWTKEHNGGWATQCGELLYFTFPCQVPTKYKFCPHCGRPIHENVRDQGHLPAGETSTNRTDEIGG